MPLKTCSEDEIQEQNDLNYQMKGVAILRPSWLCNWNDLKSKNLHPIITDPKCNSVISDAARSSRSSLPTASLWALIRVTSCPPATVLVCQELLQHLPAAARPSFQKQSRRSCVAVTLGFALTDAPFVSASSACVISSFECIGCKFSRDLLFLKRNANFIRHQ